MAEPVRARRLTDQEGQRLQQIVRRGKHGSVRVRRAIIIMASASGTLVPAIARLVAADEDTVRDVIHLFNAKGLAALDPQWAGGRPRLIRRISRVATTAELSPSVTKRPSSKRRWPGGQSPGCSRLAVVAPISTTTSSAMPSQAACSCSFSAGDTFLAHGREAATWLVTSSRHASSTGSGAMGGTRQGRSCGHRVRDAGR
jgi:Winged helix-turn helix